MSKPLTREELLMSKPLTREQLRFIFKDLDVDANYQIYIDDEYRAYLGEGENANILSWDEGSSDERVDCWIDVKEEEFYLANAYELTFMYNFQERRLNIDYCPIRKVNLKVLCLLKA